MMAPWTLVIVGVLMSGQSDGTEPPEPSNREKTATTVQKKIIRLHIAGREWGFSPAHDRGLVAIGHDGQQSIQMNIGSDLTGRALDFDVATRTLPDGRYVIGLGLSALQAQGENIEYWMFQLLENPNRPRVWTPCGPLIVRSRDNPFDIMAVGLPGGDSLMLTLQDLTRAAGGSDEIESHVFVNHCPAAATADLNAQGTAHHKMSGQYLFTPQP